MKKILLVTQYFYPENFKGNDIAFELAKRGYCVDVLTGIPNYPEGRVYSGYGFFRKRVERINGVNIYRCFQIARGKGGGARMMLNYLSFTLSACIHVLLFFVWRRYDAVVVQGLSPIFQALPAILYKKIRRRPIYLWVLDIWPDALRSGGGIKNEKVISAVDQVVKYIYNNCDRLLISSKRMRESICPKGDYEDKIVYFPNWSDDILSMPTTYPVPALPQGFIIMVAGNLGTAQDLEAIARSIVELRDIEELKWVFVGDGTRKGWLEQFVQDNDLSEQVYILGRFPAEAMPALFQQAGAMLVTLRSSFPHLGMIVPARLQSYMSAGRPVLAMIGNGGADIIHESGCGYAAPAGDSSALSATIRNSVLSDKESFEQRGELGRAYFERNFTKERCIDNLVTIISKEDE